MHHCMHDLAISVAGSESFMINLGAEDVSSKIWHMSFGWNLSIGRSCKLPAMLPGAIKTRTFFLSAPRTHSISYSYESENPLYATILSNFKRLRVLDLHNLGMNMVPSCIRKLRHLRYLDLSCNGGIQTLPNSITKLRNLQTLNLFGCSLKELPRDIRKLASLRHLELSFHNRLTDMPRGLGQLTSLRTLKRFIVGRCNRLSELKDLNNLRGELSIELPNRLPCSERPRLGEAEEANLEGKEFLQSLKFNFGNNSYDDDDDDGDLGLVLEALQAHANLKKLKIEDCKVMRLPTWMSSLSNLVEISLSRCMGCKYLPKIEHLSCLKSLHLRDLFSLEYIDDDNSCGVNNDLLSSSREPTTTTFFPSLQYISFLKLPNLKGWSRNKEALLPSFPCLLESEIRCCPRLTSMPLQPTVVKLVFGSVSEKVVQQQFVATTSSSLVPLSNLKELVISGMDRLVTLPEGLLPSLQKLTIVLCERLTSLSRGMQHLTSLQKLKIVSCESLTSLSRGMRHLTALMSLEIHYCQELDLSDGDDDGMHFQGLRNLTSLFILRNPKLESLPAGLQHVTTLQELSILDCENWKGLPEWIGNLTSLQHLWIRPYRKFTSLPQGMSRLTALQRLVIEDCSQELKDRCQKEMGEDWPKIAHIPEIYIHLF